MGDKNNNIYYTGSCFCGKCIFESTTKPTFKVICHCNICTRISGGIAVAYVGFSDNDLKIIDEQNNLTSYKSTENMERYFCKTCFSNVYNQSLIPDLQFRDCPLSNFKTDLDGKIEHINELKPENHINFDNCKPCYVDMFKKDGLLKFSGMPGSRIIEN